MRSLCVNTYTLHHGYNTLSQNTRKLRCIVLVVFAVADGVDAGLVVCFDIVGKVSVFVGLIDPVDSVLERFVI